MKTSEIALGQHRFDTETGRLTDPAGQDVELRHQTREVLKLLAETPGETVGKTAFRERIWGRTHVGEDSLVQCIADLRQALGDADRRIVETIPRRGYRLAVPRPAAPPRRARVLAAAAVVLLMAAGLFAVLFWPRDSPASRVVAVLPFRDTSPAEHRGLLADPVSEEILAYLARYPELTVIARGSSFRFRETDRDLREIGALLGTGYVVEGSVHFDGRRVAVNAALVDVRANARVWSDRIEADLKDLLDLTAEVGKRVASQVEGFVSDVQVSAAEPVNPDAMLLNLQARKAALGGVSKAINDRVIALNREAIDRFPEDAWGHMGLAFALRVRLRFGWAEDADATLAEAVGHAEKAVGLAPGNYAAHFALGRVRMQQGNQLRAIEAFETALQLNPSSADTMNALAQSYFYLGQTDRALEALAQSARIDPLPSFVHSWMTAWVLWQANRCEDAERAFARLAAPPPEAHKLLAAIHACLGAFDTAAQALDVFLTAEPDWTLETERAVHAGVWQFGTGLESWLADLKRAGMPQGR